MYFFLIYNFPVSNKTNFLWSKIPIYHVIQFKLLIIFIVLQFFNWKEGATIYLKPILTFNVSKFSINISIQFITESGIRAWKSYLFFFFLRSAMAVSDGIPT